jgi:hypothetical protein
MIVFLDDWSGSPQPGTANLHRAAEIKISDEHWPTMARMRLSTSDAAALSRHFYSSDSGLNFHP